MAKVSLGDLQVDFDLNPRQKINNKAVLQYSDAIREIIEQDLDFHKVWEQPIEVTKDKIVVRGAHTVLALCEIYDDDHLVEVRHVRIGDKVAEGREDAKWLSAQSNKKGINFGDGEISKAIEFMLDQMQPTSTSAEDGKRPFMSERPIAIAIGCGRSIVNKVRNKWYMDNGFEDLVEERKKPTPATEEELSESAKAADVLLEKQKAKSSKKGKKDTKDKPTTKKDTESLNEDIEGLDDLDLGEDTEDTEEAQLTHPMDEAYEKAEDEEEPEDEEDEDVRAKTIDGIESRLDKLITMQPDPLMFGEIEVIMCGRDIVDVGIIKETLGDKFEGEDVDAVIDLFKFFIESLGDECK